MSANNSCLLCGRNCINCNTLSNGLKFHKDCYNEELDSIFTLTSSINAIKGKIYRKQSLLSETQNFGHKLKSFFGGSKIDAKKIESQILNFENEINELKIAVDDKKNQLQKLYDYWLEIPPDWNLRRGIVKQKAFNQCTRCGEEHAEKHVHHKIPISKGGNHRIDNLEYLCANCHSEAHHGRDVSIENKNDLSREKSAYAKKLETIQHAIDNDEIIHFSYKKYHGDKSIRSISPEYLEQKGKSLCVAGYCYLRDEDRIFAIKRMSRVKIVNEPGNCHDK